MASNGGKWEVVGKGGKARKNEHTNKKNRNKTSDTDLPKVDIKEPIPQSKTQFHAFNEKGEHDVAKIQEVNDYDDVKEEGDIEPIVEVNKKYEKKRKTQQKEQQLTLKEVVSHAFSKFDVPFTTKCIEDSKQRYDNNLITMKELIKTLQEALHAMSVEKDPILEKETSDFPLNCLDEEVVELIEDELGECKDSVIDKLLLYCLDELLIEINKGRATFGIRVMVQIINRCSPLVSIRNKEELLERVVTRRNNSREALSLLWVYGQTSNAGDIVERLTVWTALFLPFIMFKQVGKFVVEYLDTTLSLPIPRQLNEPAIDGKRFQYLMELLFVSPSQPFAFRRELQSLYPKIKSVVFASFPASPLTDVFHELLLSLNNECSTEYLREALSCLLRCLELDATCHFKWRNNYLVKLKESSMLLDSLVEEWDIVCRSVPRKYLMETVMEFKNANKELKLRDKQKSGLAESEASCSALLEAMAVTPMKCENSSSRFYRFIKFVLFMLFVFVCFDIYKHDGYGGSKTEKVLKQSGLEKGLLITYDYSKVYTRRLENWTEKNYPYYYNQVKSVVEPTTEYTMSKLRDVLIYLADITLPIRIYIHRTLPPVLEKVETVLSTYFNYLLNFLTSLWTTYYPVAKQYTRVAWDALAFYVPHAWGRLSYATWYVRRWLYSLSPEFFNAVADGWRHVIEVVVTRTPHVMALVQEYMLTAWKLVISGVTAIVAWVQALLNDVMKPSQATTTQS